MGETLHDLCHAFGQWCINEGVPEAMVQVALRHADPDPPVHHAEGPGRTAKAIARVLA